MNRNLFTLCAILAIILLSVRGAFAGAPATPIRPVIDDYFGVKVTDPYRYLEDLTNPGVQTWFKAQADYADAQLNNLPTRAGFIADIEKYVNSEPVSIREITRAYGGHYFLLKQLPSENVAKLYMRQGVDGKDVLLLDTDKFAGPRGEPAAINYYAPSYDARYVAVGVSTGGSEAAVIHIIDTQTGKEFPETIDRGEFGDVAWLPDNHSFCYCRLQKLAVGQSDNDKYLNTTIYLHQLNTSPDADAIIFKKGHSSRVEMTSMDEPFVIIEPNSAYVLGVVEHGVQAEHTLYCAPLASLQSADIPWTKICDVEDGITGFTFHGDDLFLFTHKDAPHFKALKLSFSHPDLSTAVTILPAGEGVLRDMQPADDALYVREIQGGLSHLIRIPYDGSQPAKIAMPFEGSVNLIACDQREPGVLFGLTSWTRALQVYKYDLATSQVVHLDLQPLGPYDNRDDITSIEVSAPSYDGALVPLSIIYKKGIKLDGTNPTTILAYGAYGITYDPGLSLSSLAWLDHGGIAAVAHVRGGGENGQDWYKAGYKLTKPNTWRDLIACAEYMIAHKYTSASHLGIWGGSAGGITVGRAITARPDLFAAADIRAGAVNTLRAELSPNGAPNIPEFGSTGTEEGFEDLLAMDAYQHVRDGTAYPGVILTVGMNDPRVTPWEPAKMAARLQAATSSERPILLRVDYKGGHGIGSSKQQRIEQQADMFAFFWSQFSGSK